MFMVRLNQNELTGRQLEDLFRQFSKLLSVSSDKDVNVLLEKLLGPEERIMLSKRLAIAVLLEKNYSYNQIADVLHVSVSTVSKLDNRLRTDEIKKIVNVVKKDKITYNGVAKLIENLLTVGGIMPSRTGLDRYRGM